MARTLAAWMPKPTEVENKYKVFQVEDGEDEEEAVNVVDELNEVVEITVDSGAARSVWPRTQKGVKRQHIHGEEAEAGGGERDEH